MMPAVPGMDSSITAAIVAAPSITITCSRWASARWPSSSGVVAEKALR